MINFAFYQKMRPILKDGAFNPGDYTPAELKMLFESLPVIYSEYCNETFRLGALEYLREHKTEYPRAHQLALKDKFNPPSQSFLPSLCAKHSSLDEALAELDSLEKENEGELVLIRISNYELIEYSELKEDLLTIYSNRYLYLSAIELSNYYSKWLCTQKGFTEEGFFRDTLSIIKYCNNIEVLERILKDTGSVENCNDVLDIKETFKVTHGFKNFNLLSRNEKGFWLDLIALKGFEGIKLALNAISELDALRQYFFSLSLHQEDFTANDETGSAEPRKITWDAIKVTKDNVDKFCDEIKKATTTDYDSVIWPEDNKGLDFTKLRALAKKYEMPSDLLQKLFDEEFPKFQTQKDSVREILGHVFANIKLDSNYEPKKAEKGEVSFLLKKAQTGKSINLKVILQPKTSPTGLFVGKMTDCCQYYTGHASEKLVMPVYTDPNAGLITINQGSEVIAESFVYLTQNQSGALEGLVLEAFTDRHAKGALLPLLKSLAKGLAQEGLKLYLGAFHNAKLSIIEEGDATTNAPILPMQKPATESYEPYAHSRGVYLIAPEEDYEIDFIVNDEEIDGLDDFLLSIPDDIAIKLKESPEIMKEILYTNPSLHRFLPSLSVETIDLLKFLNEHSEHKINSGSLSGILNLFSIIPKEFFERNPVTPELVSHLGEFLKTGISYDLSGITAVELETLIYWNTYSDQKVNSSNFKQVLELSASVPSDTLKDIAELPSSLQWADILKDSISVIARSYTREQKQKLKNISNLYKFYLDPSKIEINKLILDNCSEEELSKLDKFILNINDLGTLQRIKGIFALSAEGQIDAITNGQNDDLFLFNQSLKTYINKTKDTFSAKQIMDFLEIITAYPFTHLSYATPEKIEELNLHKLIQIVHMQLDSETSSKLCNLILESKTDFASITPDNLNDFLGVETPSSVGCVSEAPSAGCASAAFASTEQVAEENKHADVPPLEWDPVVALGAQAVS